MFARLFIALIALSCVSACEPFEARERPAGTNVILISLDTLRADHLGLYGYARDTSLAIDAFGSRSVVFERVVAPSAWTPPSHATMLTGLHPPSHGVNDRDHRLRSGVPLLAEILAERGYRTRAITGGGFVNESRFGRGFETFESTDAPFADTLASAKRWIDRHEDEEPWFIFLHTYDIHCPYALPEPYFSMYVEEEQGVLDPPMPPGSDMALCRKYEELNAAQIEYLAGRYDGGIRWVDNALRGFFADLERDDLFERTIVILTSDHGEEFFEHGRGGHGQTLYSEQLFVPLVIAAPQAQPRRVGGLVGLADIVPTVLDLAGHELPDGLDGRSLEPWIHGGAGDQPPSAPQFSSLIKNVSKVHTERTRIFSWMDERHHLIVDELGDSTRLFEWPRDPTEAEDLAASRPEQVGRLTAELRAFEELSGRQVASTDAAEPPSAREIERLRALGYVQD